MLHLIHAEQRHRSFPNHGWDEITPVRAGRTISSFEVREDCSSPLDSNTRFAVLRHRKRNCTRLNAPMDPASISPLTSATRTSQKNGRRTKAKRGKQVIISPRSVLPGRAPLESRSRGWHGDARVRGEDGTGSWSMWQTISGGTHNSGVSASYQSCCLYSTAVRVCESLCPAKRQTPVTISKGSAASVRFRAFWLGWPAAE